MSFVIHLIRALKQWIKVHNDLPRSTNQNSPNAIMNNDHQIDAKYQYRSAFGDVVSYNPLSETELWLFLRDKQGIKGRRHVYQLLYWHRIITIGDVHRITVVELMECNGKRAYVRQSGLEWGYVESAMLDLLKD